MINAREDCRLNKYPERIRELRVGSLLRVSCLSLIQELYNHWEISRSDAGGFNRSRKQGFASSLCEQLTLTLIEMHSEYYIRKDATQEKRKCSLPWAKT